jgi:hypothetical protein
MAGNYKAELDALQAWIWKTAGVKAVTLQDAPPKLARPVILWEPPSRKRDRNLTRYSYVNAVTQYGKLYVSSLKQLDTIEEALLGDLEEKVGVLSITDAAGNLLGRLKQVEIAFQNSETLDVPFTIKYEVTYGRTRPVAPPPATFVGNKITTTKLGG